MKQFDLKKFIKENKATFYSSLSEDVSGTAEKFAQYISKKEGKKFTVTPGSVDEKSFDLDLDGEEYAGGSYLVKDNGDIVNVAIGNKVAGNINQLEEGEAAYEYEKGKKAGEEIEKKKIKKSELKEIYIAHLDKEVDNKILSYMADVFISNAKDGDRNYEQFIDLNLRDAIFDIVSILNDKRHPLYKDAWDEYNTIEADKARGLFRENKSQSKMKVSELKAKIKEMVLAEAKDDEEEEEVTDEEEVDVDVEDPEPMEEPMGDGGISVAQNADADLTGIEKEVQDNLEAALKAAQELNDEKLQQQIGNSLTFFTRTHVVK